MARLTQFILARGRERRVQSRHPWVYRSEVAEVNGAFEPGDMVDVVDSRGRFLARGYANPRSEIVVRVLTHSQEAVDRDFFARRLSDALAYRKRIMPDEESFRLVFSEGDLLPGLIVDKYGEYLVLQFLTLGMEARRVMVIELLDGLLHPAGMYDRSDVGSRRLEGLEEHAGNIAGHVPQVITIRESGLKFIVDVHGGQKTGFFLDQKENRRLVGPLSKGARVLDAFCHSGTFALSAAQGGAREVVGLDISADALALARENADLNGYLDICRFVTANAFDYLRETEKARERFDVVILDPPAFTKTRDALPGAIRGYKEINLRAFKILNPGGFLLTCSCSHHMDPELFRKVVEEAAADAKKTVRLVTRGSQAKDHPILGGVKETEYLKALLYQVVNE